MKQMIHAMFLLAAVSIISAYDIEVETATVVDTAYEKMADSPSNGQSFTPDSPLLDAVKEKIEKEGRGTYTNLESSGMVVCRKVAGKNTNVIKITANPNDFYLKFVGRGKFIAFVPPS